MVIFLIVLTVRQESCGSHSRSYVYREILVCMFSICLVCCLLGSLTSRNMDVRCFVNSKWPLEEAPVESCGYKHRNKWVSKMYGWFKKKKKKEHFITVSLALHILCIFFFKEQGWGKKTRRPARRVFFHCSLKDDSSKFFFSCFQTRRYMSKIALCLPETCQEVCKRHPLFLSDLNFLLR